MSKKLMLETIGDLEPDTFEGMSVNDVISGVQKKLEQLVKSAPKGDITIFLNTVAHLTIRNITDVI